MWLRMKARSSALPAPARHEGKKPSGRFYLPGQRLQRGSPFTLSISCSPGSHTEYHVPIPVTTTQSLSDRLGLPTFVRPPYPSSNLFEARRRRRSLSDEPEGGSTKLLMMRQATAKLSLRSTHPVRGIADEWPTAWRE